MKVMAFAIKIAVSLMAAFIIAEIFIPVAYAERGYYAVGGEWILILGAAMGTYAMLHRAMKD